MSSEGPPRGMDELKPLVYSLRQQKFKQHQIVDYVRLSQVKRILDGNNMTNRRNRRRLTNTAQARGPQLVYLGSQSSHQRVLTELPITNASRVQHSEAMMNVQNIDQNEDPTVTEDGSSMNFDEEFDIDDFINEDRYHNHNNLFNLHPEDVFSNQEPGTSREIRTVPVLESTHLSLIRACADNDLNAVKKLIEAGAEVNGDDGEDGPPLIFAAESGYIDIVRLLCEKGADVNRAHIKDRRQAMHQAANYGQLVVVKELLLRKAEHDTPMMGGRTPLWLAAEEGHEAVVRMLLAAGEINVDAVEEKSGYRPLHVAALEGYSAIARMLLEHGANHDASSENNHTPLFLASQIGDVATVQQLLNRDARVDTTDKETQRTPLHQAAFNGHYEIVNLLLESDADPECNDKEGHTPLTLVAIEGYTDIAQLLIEKCKCSRGAPGTSPKMLGYAASQGNSDMVSLILDSGVNSNAVDAKDDVVAIARAAENNHIHVVKYLHSKGADVNAASRSDGYRAVHRAASGGHLEMMVVLSQLRAALDPISKNGYTPLMLASQTGNIDLVRFLLRHKANIEARANSTGVTAVHLAAENGHSKVVFELILRGTDKDIETYDGVTPLWLASQKGDLNTVRRLLDQYNASVHTTAISSGRQPIHQAIAHDFPDTVEVLLNAGASVNVGDFENQTPLHLAVANGNRKIVMSLLQRGARNEEQETSLGYYPLHLAAAIGSTEIVHQLIVDGASVHVTDFEGLNPLWAAVLKGKKEVVQYLIERGSRTDILHPVSRQTMLHMAAGKGNEEVVIRLLKAGVRVNDTDADGNTALHRAAASGYAEIVQLLCAADADVDFKSFRDEITPLHCAAASGDLQTVLCLLDHNALPDPRDSRGITPLSLAAENGEYRAVTALLKKGANANSTDDLGMQTPLHAAAGSERARASIVQLLLDHDAKPDPLDKDNCSPLWFASQNGRADIVKILLSCPDVSPNTCARDLDRTCLQQAAKNGYLTIVQHLMAAGAKPDGRGSIEGDTALMLASINGHYTIVKELLKWHADVNASSSVTGRQALHLAAIEGNTRIVELLLQYHADTDHKDFKGFTAFTIAQKLGNSAIVFQILAHKTASVHMDANGNGEPIDSALSGPNMEEVDGQQQAL